MKCTHLEYHFKPSCNIVWGVLLAGDGVTEMVVAVPLSNFNYLYLPLDLHPSASLKKYIQTCYYS